MFFTTNNMKVYLILILFLFTNKMFSQSMSKKTDHFNLTNGVIDHGYDLVSYFELNKSQKGIAKIMYKYMGVTYYFATTAHREKFISNPIKYEPQYGGWCAYAMGDNGDKVDIDPDTFKIYQGKLYLFYHTWLNNTLNKWNVNELNLKIAADKNWTQIKK